MENENKMTITWKEKLILRGLRNDFKYVLKHGVNTTITTEKPNIFENGVGLNGEIIHCEWFNLNFDGLIQKRIYKVEELIGNE